MKSQHPMFRGVFLGIVLLVLATCSSQTEPIVGVAEAQGVPMEIRQRADSIIIEQVGLEMFRESFTYDSLGSAYLPADSGCLTYPDNCADYLMAPYYRLVYTFQMSGKPFIHEHAGFFLDTEGRLIQARGLWGIPNCEAEATECDFPIDALCARSIAHDAGLDAGVTDWRLSFHWFGGLRYTYVWTVSNSLTPSSGQTVVIDANTGVVLEVSAWKNQAKTP